MLLKSKQPITKFLMQWLQEFCSCNVNFNVKSKKTSPQHFIQVCLSTWQQNEHFAHLTTKLTMSYPFISLKYDQSNLWREVFQHP
jgi:hypothetical protein